MRMIVVAALGALLSGCASLVAEAPLFPAGAVNGPAPIEAGVWAGVNTECTEVQARRRRPPADCYTIELRQSTDGSWRVPFTVEDEDAPGGVRNMVMRVVFAPAVENMLPDTFAPLYLAELQQLEPEPEASVSYAVIAPLGPMPSRAFSLIAEIGCDDVFRQGPIDGVRDERVPANPEMTAEDRTAWDAESPRERRGSDGRCVATTQAGAREAARRAVIENIDDMFEQRMIWLRPLPE